MGETGNVVLNETFNSKTFLPIRIGMAFFGRQLLWTRHQIDFGGKTAFWNTYRLDDRIPGEGHAVGGIIGTVSLFGSKSAELPRCESVFSVHGQAFAALFDGVRWLPVGRC